MLFWNYFTLDSIWKKWKNKYLKYGLKSLVTIRMQILGLRNEKKKSKQMLPARAVTLIIVFKNIYQIFRPATLLKHMLITNQYVQQIIV